MSASEGFARRYRLLERIAIGGTAEVFRAQLVVDGGAKRPVVIKRVLPQFARDERFRRLFLEEACLTATLAHPNIVRVLDHGEIDQTCFITLELVDGLDLGSLLAQTRRGHGPQLPVGLAVLIAVQVADALQFIHDQTSSEGLPLRIIHRDVSPQNILVSYQGDVKLTDFGIAKSAIRQEHTVDGTLRGKLDYMSPEQARGLEVDHRADIFGLGCVLFEMVVGTPPFRGESEIETLDRLRQEDGLQLPADLVLPLSLHSLIERALARDPDARYQQADRMSADLRILISELEEPPSMDELGSWAVLVAGGRATAPGADAVDDAVRMLFGDAGEGEVTGAAPTAPARELSAAVHASTSVFATTSSSSIGLPRSPSSSVPLVSSATSELSAPEPSSGLRRQLLIAAPLVVLGLLGWVLWMVDRSPAPGLQRRSTTGASETSADSGQRGTAGSRDGGATAASPVVGDAADGATRGPDGRSTVTRRRTAGLVRYGYLTVNSMPWSRVHLDGQFVGNTPLVRMQVTAGSHQVQLRGPDGRLRHAFVADIPVGRTRPYSFDLTRTKPR